MHVLFVKDLALNSIIVYTHAFMCLEGNEHIGTIHQLSTCNQHFGGLMTVRFNDHMPPASELG